jgi:hypothetical protein
MWLKKKFSSEYSEPKVSSDVALEEDTLVLNAKVD